MDDILDELNNTSKDEKIDFILSALEQAKMIVSIAMQQLSIGAMPQTQSKGWMVLNLLVREKERELEQYLFDKEDDEED